MMKTLSGRDYHAAEVFEVERERIFARNWFYAGRVEALAEAGDFMTVDVAGESVIVLRDKDERLHGFYNVCRHRGSRLCDELSGRMKGAVKCPYHAWSYSFDGRLIGTPNVGKDELDRDALGLWPVEVDVWEGFLFVHLDADPQPLEAWLGGQHDGPLSFARFNLTDLRSGHTTVTEVKANWKILIENYNECLHCPTVHPELVAVVPAFRKGSVYDAHRGDGGVAIVGGGTSFTRTGQSSLPVMPGLDEHDSTSLYGCTVFPNMFIDVTGTGAIATTLLPREPGHTTVVTDYLFRPEAIADPGFDPSEIVEFVELVAHQDYVVCERVQRGVRSRAFTHGVLAEKDALLDGFNTRYLQERGPA
ncbi:MAG TPA: aromatic ring-hydroxylating dioxygenase subunit alpha [Gaiellales bacterium]|jgi:Rieske 2Fe-2S family protein